jgi:hypothetical protein
MTFLKTLNSNFDFFDGIDPHTLFLSIVAFCTVMYIWENYLEYRQVIK